MAKTTGTQSKGGTITMIMSVYVKERLEGKVIPYMMEEAIKEVLEKEYGEYS